MATKEEKQSLMALARSAITTHLSAGKQPNFKNNSKIFSDKKGVFVSLYVQNRLRGCIGSLLPASTLYSSIIKHSVDAACHDCRFPPLTRRELNNLRIEISILTDPVRLDYIDVNHLLNKLEAKEGIILKKGMKMATFLPQVWEKISNKEEFLTHLCTKAGLGMDEWRDSDAEVYVYNAESFKG